MDNSEAQLRSALADRYDIEREVGRGGMAIVYAAIDRKHKRRVAIKVVLPGIGAELGTERFLAEIQIVAQLSHPNILPLYDSGEAGGTLFFVMPFIDGESLRDRLRQERQLPVDEAIHITRGVAVALAYAHARGIIHRDIKPENVMLTGGEPLVADFGIATVMREAGGSGGDIEDMVAGTPEYMSPEQTDPEAQLDGRSDIFSLGCMLYEMLAGDPPYTGPTALAITAAKFVGPIPHVRDARSSVPQAIENVVERALAQEPAGRYPTALQMAKALSESGARDSGGHLDARSIAVLPFSSRGGDEDHDFLGDGIAEELIHALGRLDGLHVVARSSSFAFKGKPDDVREIGRRLGVGAVLGGSVRRSANRLRVMAELVDAGDGFQVWSDKYDKTVDDVFAVQDDIARAVVEALKPALLGGGDSLPSSATSYEAYEAYLKGRHAWNLRTEHGLHEAMAHFERAVAADPGYALAHAGLADSCTTLGIYGLAPPAELAARGEAAAERAVALGPQLAEARTALACARAIFRWDWETADREFRHATALKPQYATALHWRAINCLAPQGRLAEARTVLERALHHDPLSASAKVSRALISYFERDNDRALEECLEVLTLEPRFGMARYFGGLAMIGLDRMHDAIEAFRDARELVGPTAEILAALAAVLAQTGSEAEARKLLGELQERANKGYVSSVALAQVHLGLGEHARALSLLEHAVSQRAVELIWLKVRPTYDPLRGDPRFDAILGTVFAA